MNNFKPTPYTSGKKPDLTRPVINGDVYYTQLNEASNHYQQGIGLNSKLPTGYVTNKVYVNTVIPDKPFYITNGLGITLEQLPDNGVKVSNTGLAGVKIYSAEGSGLFVSQYGSNDKPEYKISLDKNSIEKELNTISSIVYAGVEYKAINGKITLSSNSTAGIQYLQSNNKTINILPISLGISSIDIKPLKINDNVLDVNSDGTLLNLVDGKNTKVVISNGKVSINADQSSSVQRVIFDGTTFNPTAGGDVIINTATAGVQKNYQATLTLTAPQIAQLGTTGLNLSSVVPTNGNTTSIASIDVVMIYIDDKFVPLTSYTRSNGNITYTASLTVGQNLSWIIFKN